MCYKVTSANMRMNKVWFSALGLTFFFLFFFLFPASRCCLAAFICKWTGNCVGKQLGIPHHKGAREMEAGRSEKKQTGSDKVTRQKKWADAHQRAKTVCGESGLQRATVLRSRCFFNILAACFHHTFQTTSNTCNLRVYIIKNIRQQDAQQYHLSTVVHSQ